MELKNCKSCDKVFLYTGVRSICPECVEKEEKEFELVKQYLWDHPNSSLTEVSEATGVEEKKVLKYLREGRISLGNKSDLKLECEICGTVITYGRICAKCAKALGGGSIGSYSNGKEEEKPPLSGNGGKLFTEHLLKRRRDNR